MRFKTLVIMFDKLGDILYWMLVTLFISVPLAYIIFRWSGCEP